MNSMNWQSAALIRTVFAIVLVATTFQTQAGAPPGIIPSQDQAIEVAEKFLDALDAYAEGDKSALRLAVALTQGRIREQELVNQVRSMMDEIGGPTLKRSLLEIHIQSSGDREHIVIRFRAIARRGSVYQDVRLESYFSRNWRVLGWSLAPAGW
jgi:hypothetical protein